MSRDKFDDIPEAFRRAFEEAGWNREKDNGGNGPGDGRRPPFPPRNSRSPQQIRSLWIIGLIFLLFISLNWIVRTYTEWLWFTELVYQNVWFKRWLIQLVSFVVAFALAAAILLTNWRLARRRAMRATPPYNPNLLEYAGIPWLINGVGLFLAFGFAGTGSAQWETFLRYFYRVDFGAPDPIFGKDISFYLFELPVYDFLQGWLLSLLFMTLIGVAAIYALNYLPDIQRRQWRPQSLPILRQHVALIGALWLGLWAVGYALDIYKLLYSSRGVVFGASYTDMNASLWALRAQLVFIALAALAVVYNIFRLSVRPMLATGGLWLAATLLVGGLYPGLLQRYAVEPNEIERERPYIEYNIEYTRLAFGLDKVETRPFDTISNLTAQDLAENESVLQNVRLWDYRPLQDTYKQLQALRTYYQFGEVDIDRYEIDGEQRQVMLAARELNKADLPSPSWVNQNLEFTHGYGLVMNPVDKITTDGQPEFFIKDFPPQTTIDLEINRPEIYYGEMTDDHVFVSSGREEFNYPSGNENVYTSYEGDGGVPLDSFFKRLAFAIRLGDTNVLLSDEIDGGTKVQFHRQIVDRVKQVTPFLALDGDPYIMVWNGRLVWMLDAYTYSNRFPYATPIDTAVGQLNYIRNAAKITVDAYDGNITYYITDEADPIIQTYARAFPNLFKSLDEMPEGLQAHIRYPEGLFDIQMQQYLRYHMQDVRVFYNQEDKWQIPFEIFDTEQQAQPIEPYYVTMPLPGDDEPEYLLIQPFNPAEKDNMIAWAAARNDLPHYGELIVYELPKQELVFGPIQVEGRIDQEPEISQQFSLWDQRGSRIIRGNLLVIPINESFLYVEPIYLQSDTSALPELKRVIVASDTRIAMDTTLEGALAALLDAAPSEIAVEVETEPTSTEVDETPTEAVEIDATVEEFIQSANAHFEAAEAAQKVGDWATYGEELDALQQDLERLLALSGQ
ncbi:MAG: UPF0182 family protein [Chloroflexi bacterium]|nr:UPF0182 family protein [Chloroflexota bacterium]